MVRALVLAAVVWPFVLGGAVAARARDAAPGFVTAVYVAGSRICHQRSERSFHSQGVKWPVCARCSGLYLGGAVGALAWLVIRRRRPASGPLGWLVAAAVPTALTFPLEWGGAGVGNLARALAGVPLGALIAIVILHTADHGEHGERNHEAHEAYEGRQSRRQRR
jgi:uncharacterized membrane protein